MNDEANKQFWQQYLATLPTEHPHKEAKFSAWYFGDSPAMADELGALVVQGTKTATASSVWEYEHDDETMPVVGEISIILDGRESPICIVETTDTSILPFNEVGEKFAHDEGEGDRSLAYWREVHKHFFTRALKRIEREFSETMPIFCERFRVIYVP